MSDARPVSSPCCLYVFLDEGGNLDFSATGSSFFTVSAVTLKRPFPWQAELAALKYELIETGLDVEYFHASEDRQPVRDRVFAIIQRVLPELRIDSLIVEKRKTGPALRPVEQFYPRMLGYLLRYLVNDVDASAYSEIVVVTDALPVERKRRAVEKTVKITLAKMLPAGTRYRVLHHASKSSFELQVADYCNWAVFRKWERGDSRSYDLVRPAVRSEYDIFQSGTKLYY